MRTGNPHTATLGLLQITAEGRPTAVLIPERRPAFGRDAGMSYHSLRRLALLL